MPEVFEGVSKEYQQASSSLEAIAVLFTPTNANWASTEGNPNITVVESAMKQFATDKSPLACQDCSVLQGSKMHADIGSISLLLLVVLSHERNIFSVKDAHGQFPRVSEGANLEAAAMRLAVSCLKWRRLVVP